MPDTALLSLSCFMKYFKSNKKAGILQKTGKKQNRYARYDLCDILMQLKINLSYILEPGYVRNQFLFLKEIKDMGTTKIRVTLEKTRKRLEKNSKKNTFINECPVKNA